MIDVLHNNVQSFSHLLFLMRCCKMGSYECHGRWPLLPSRDGAFKCTIVTRSPMALCNRGLSMTRRSVLLEQKEEYFSFVAFEKRYFPPHPSRDTTAESFRPRTTEHQRYKAV